MRTILLSFEPEWFDKLESGNMKFEYRKNFPVGPTKVYFYVSYPRKAITGIGVFGVRQNLNDWKAKYADAPKDVLNRIDEYLIDCRYAIPLISFQKTNMLFLQNLRDNISQFVVPRMYYYIEPNSELQKYLDSNIKYIGDEFKPNSNQIGYDDICI